VAPYLGLKKKGKELPNPTGSKEISAETSCDTCECEKESGLKALSEGDDFEALTGGKVPTLVRFTATWCKPCKIVEKVYNDEGKDSKKSLFLTVDVDAFDEVAAKCGAFTLPRIVVFVEGKAVATHTGKEDEGVRAFIKEHAQF
jgi:thioredoxin 1